MQRQKQRLVHRRLSELYAKGSLQQLQSYNCLVRLYWDTYEPELPSYEQASAETITRAFRRMLHHGQFKMGDSFERRRQDIAEQYRTFYQDKEPDPIVFTGPDYRDESPHATHIADTQHIIIPHHLGGIRIED